MRFPYQRSAGQDLRDLFKYERLRTSTDDLGQSSIDEGSGSLEVRDGDGTTVVGIGDLPGGGVGIAIRYDGSLTSLIDLLRDLADRLEVVEEMGPGDGSGNNDVWDARQDRNIAGLRRRASNIEGKNTTQDQKLGTLGSRADDTDVDLAGLAKRVKALEDAKVSTQTGLVKAQQSANNNAKAIGELDTVSRRHGTAINDQRNKGDTLENLVEEARRNRENDKSLLDRLIEWADEIFNEGGAVAELADTTWRNQAEVTQARGGQSNLKGRIDGVASTASGAASAASAAQSSADSAQSTANSAQTAAGNAQSTANSAQSAASAAQASANQANDRITDARGSDGSLTVRLNRMENATSAADTKATNAQTTANTANTKATNAQTDVQRVETDLTSAVSALLGYINNLRARVAALDGGPGGPVGP